MDKKKFTIVAQYLGFKFLDYVLNTNEELTQDTDFDGFAFSEQQLKVLTDLSERLRECRIRFVMEGSYGGNGDDAILLLRLLLNNNINLFNNYRKNCGGNLPTVNTDDNILNFLAGICIREYPNLLIKPSIHQDFNINISYFNEFIFLVKQDELNAITNKKDDFEYKFVFTTEDGLKFCIQVGSAYSIIISRSFHNACNKMNYSLDGVIGEIQANVEALRKLANGQEIEYSSFVGVRGLIFNGFDSINLGVGCLRQIDNISNPHPCTQDTVSMHSDDNGKNLTGHVLEVKHRTKIASHSSHSTCAMTSELNNAQDRMIDNLRFAISFSLLEDKGLSTSFSENGFPLIQPGNYSFSNRSPKKYLHINLEHLDDIGDWFSRLSQAKITSLKIPLKRLKYAIFERDQAEDSIVDAIIAWEGLFSGKSETTFQVTGSISKYLRKPEEREEFLSRLKKLYGLRSDIVHGIKSKFMKTENFEKVRSEVIKIGLNCLKKLLKDDRLLRMSPEDRVKEIMIRR